MARALALAHRAVGSTSPNPPVGAVLVKDGRIVGEGYTMPPGQAHAEVEALQAAGPEAAGAQLYVTLEPCSHWGRTPPCTDALIAAGISGVHIAVLDPNPRVNGEGVRRLRQHGIPVSVGQGASEAAELIEAHAKYMTTGLPFITLLLDAPPEVALLLGARSDAILTDEPQPPRPAALAGVPVRAPLHVLVGPAAETQAEDERTLIVTPAGGAPGPFAASRDALSVPTRGDSLDYRLLLQELGRHEITSCLARGSPSLGLFLLSQQVVDKIVTGEGVAPPAGFTVARAEPEPQPHCLLYPDQYAD